MLGRKRSSRNITMPTLDTMSCLVIIHIEVAAKIVIGMQRTRDYARQEKVIKKHHNAHASHDVTREVAALIVDVGE
ncbi:hypothetical protein J6590_031592 [Homalodisca vitripennis]|nr:hypothetical protein J6590_031592 [Homalodisca vitripennis]